MWRVTKEAIMSIYYDDMGLGSPFIIICHDRSSLFLAVSAEIDTMGQICLQIVGHFYEKKRKMFSLVNS